MTQLHTDVAVLGVGAMGSATLWRLAERGIAAVGFEQYEPGHDRGSSHGESRMYRTAYIEGLGYVPLARTAVELWRELERVTGASLLMPIGALMLGDRDSSVITNVMKSIRAHDLPHELLDEEELHVRYPGHRIQPGEIGIRESEGGIVRPEASILTMVARAELCGARVLRRCLVDRIELQESGVRVVAGDVTCDAGHAVVSVGTWLSKLLPDLQLPIRVTRQVVGWWPVERPELFAPDRFPVFMRDLGDCADPNDIVDAHSAFYGVPTLDGESIKASIHREGPATDPDVLDPVVHREEMEPVKAAIERFLNYVVPEPVRTQVCMYENTPDHDFLVGSPPDMERLTILGGFSGHGFKFAPVMGEVAADLASEGSTAYPIDFLSPRRFSRERSSLR